MDLSFSLVDFYCRFDSCLSDTLVVTIFIVVVVVVVLVGASVGHSSNCFVAFR